MRVCYSRHTIPANVHSMEAPFSTVHSLNDYNYYPQELSRCKKFGRSSEQGK